MISLAAIGTVLLVLIFGALLLAQPHAETYKVSRVENSSCITYYEECECTGQISVLHGYPVQYECHGESTCVDIQEYECKPF